MIDLLHAFSAHALLCTIATSGAKADTNAALHKPYTTSIETLSPYLDTQGTELTDGVYAPSADYFASPWQGRTSASYSHTIAFRIRGSFPPARSNHRRFLA